MHERIASYIRAHPELSFVSIATNLGVASSTISRIAKEHELSRSNTIIISPERLEEIVNGHK
jgi:IS30 family transposase